MARASPFEDPDKGLQRVPERLPPGLGFGEIPNAGCTRCSPRTRLEPRTRGGATIPRSQKTTARIHLLAPVAVQGGRTVLLVVPGCGPVSRLRARASR